MRGEQIRQRPGARGDHRVVVGDEVPHQVGDLAAQRVLVDGHDLAVLHHHAAVDDDAFDAAAGLGVDELPRGAVVGQIRDVVQIDQHHIGLVAGLDRAELARKACGARIAERRMTEHLVRERGPGSGSLTAASRQNIFIAWNTLCTSLPLQLSQPSPSRTPGFAQVADRRDAALEFHIGEMIEDDAGVGFRHAVHLGARDPDAVHDIEPRPEQAVVLHDT